MTEELKPHHENLLKDGCFRLGCKIKTYYPSILFIYEFSICIPPKLLVFSTTFTSQIEY